MRSFAQNSSWKNDGRGFTNPRTPPSRIVAHAMVNGLKTRHPTYIIFAKKSFARMATASRGNYLCVTVQSCVPGSSVILLT
jgi:hypothetical protein